MKNKAKWLAISLACGLVSFACFKVFRYYADNRLYAHYVFDQWYDTKNSSIEDGYADKQSYAWGDTCSVFINAKKKQSTWIRLYDINKKAVDSVWVQVYPQEAQDNSSELGFGYKPTFNYQIPKLKGGVYLWEHKVPILIRGNSAQVGVLYPSNTCNAYNVYGGKSLYSIFSDQTSQVSFLRPTFPYVSFQAFFGLKHFYNHPDFSFSYLADSDMDRYEGIENLKVLVVVGHSEYWTRRARINFDRYIENGGHAIVLSGNTMWWQVRYDDDNKTMICYKTKNDPVKNPLLRTVNWSDSSLKYPIDNSIISDFNQGGYGRKIRVGFNGYKVLAKSHPIFQGLPKDQLDFLSIPSKEYDGVHLKFDDRIPAVTNKSSFASITLLAYDSLGEGKNGAFVVGRKSDSQGMVYNVGTMDWCSAYGLGGEDSTKLKAITDRMIKLCLEDREKSLTNTDH